MRLIKLKGYAVIWTNKAKEEYGVPNDKETIISVETGEGGDKRFADGGFKYIEIDYPIFRFKRDAEEFRAKNKDFKVVSCEIKLLTN